MPTSFHAYADTSGSATGWPAGTPCGCAGIHQPLARQAAGQRGKEVIGGYSG
jgi:hypothetical protein